MKADIEVTVDLARALLSEQHPDLARLPLEIVANGWDNVMMRAGTDLAVRLPRREAAAHLVEHEQAALPLVAVPLSAAVPDVALPVPVRRGMPSPALDYPWAWHVVRWSEGTPAHRTPVEARTAWAETLGRFLVALHRPAPADAPANPWRGIPVASRPEARYPDRLEARLEQTPAHVRDAALRLWHEALAAPAYDGDPVWVHGDPHPANLVVARGDGPGGTDRLAAVVDFGDITSGDPASDLGALWLIFDAAGLARCRAVIEARANGGRGWGEATWARARAWAWGYALNMLAHPDEHPELVPIGEHGLAALFEGR
jgi:aminoglycoside phosphotransferase (APT) family kinase protein